MVEKVIPINNVAEDQRVTDPAARGGISAPVYWYI
jgi:hypothetical protein